VQGSWKCRKQNLKEEEKKKKQKAQENVGRVKDF
jgi:hypothetical protein